MEQLRRRTPNSDWRPDLVPDEVPFQIPSLRAILLISATVQFLHVALIAYVIGLGVYLGFLWKEDPDINMVIFIVFLVDAAIAFFSYMLMAMPGRQEGDVGASVGQDWRQIKFWHQNGMVPKCMLT